MASDQDVIVRLNSALSHRYRIESEIGSGGMAAVYLDQDLEHDRKVAVKVIKPELAAGLGAPSGSSRRSRPQTTCSIPTLVHHEGRVGDG